MAIVQAQVGVNMTVHSHSRHNTEQNYEGFSNCMDQYMVLITKARNGGSDRPGQLHRLPRTIIACIHKLV